MYYASCRSGEKNVSIVNKFVKFGRRIIGVCGKLRIQDLLEVGGG